MTGRARRAALRVGAALLLGTLSACTPLYLPPVPERIEPTARLDVRATGSSEEGRPAVEVALREVPQPGWLAVQWFSPRNLEVASQSVRIDGESGGQVVTFRLPADVESASGRWRAILSKDGQFVRQVAIEVE